jgi:alpha-L-rhamnosidase
MLRHEFEAPKPKRAIACLTGLGYHELYLNGKKAGDRVLEPALTDYDKRVPVSYYDVTELLRDGRNAIGLWLGNGRYHAPDTEVPTPTRTYGAPLARLQLHLEFDGGKTTTILSDETWQVSDQGPIRENNDYDGEVYDARMEMPGWSEPGFDATGWNPADLLPAPKGQARHIPCPPMRVTERIKPVKLTEPTPGTFVFDFGQNLVGWTKLAVKGPRDTTVRLRFAETLRKNGNVYLTNMRGARVTDRYILSGSDETETWEPRFSYHGFRYAEVTGFPGKPTLESLEACVVHSDLEPAGSWKSSNETVNRILTNTRWGLRGNYLSIPTDCPQRDERQGWQGDRANESRGEAYLFDTAAFYTKWLDDVRDSQRDDGCVSDVCPPYWPFYSGSAVWPAVQTIVPNTLHEIFGDLRSSQRHYPGVAKWLDFQLKRLQPDGLLPPDPYGDWCAPPKDPNLIHARSPEVVTDKQFVANCYLAAQLGFAARMSRLAGKPEDADKWLAARQQLSTALLKKFWNADTASFANGTQTSSILPLAFDLVPADSRPALARSLVARIRGADQSHIGTGLIGAQWLMNTLTGIGHARLGLEIASHTTYPSWGYMLEQDATTIWELWNGNTADPAMNSGNHVMLVGDLVTWCYEHLAGIRPDAPGFGHLRMEPQAVGALGSVEAEYRSIRGPIRSSWKTNGTFTWDIQLPANTSATIFIPLPDVPNPQVTESGKPLKESPEIKILENPPPNRLALELPSGRYHFEVK